MKKILTFSILFVIGTSQAYDIDKFFLPTLKVGIGLFGIHMANVALHECAHATVARMCGLEVDGFKIGLLSGYTINVSGTPYQNIAVSAAGPIANFLIGMVLFDAIRNTNDPAYAVLFSLGALYSYNLVTFNIVPDHDNNDGQRILNEWRRLKKT